MSTFLRRSAAAALLVLVAACGGSTTSSNRDQRNAALEETTSSACLDTGEVGDGNNTLVVTVTIVCDEAVTFVYDDPVDRTRWSELVNQNKTLTLQVPVDGGEITYEISNNGNGILEKGRVRVDAVGRTRSIEVTGGLLKPVDRTSDTAAPDTTVATGDTIAAQDTGPAPSDTSGAVTDTTIPVSDTTSPQSPDATSAADTTVASETTVVTTSVDTLPTFDSVFGECGVEPTVSVNPSSPDSGTKTQVIVKWPCAMSTDRWANLSVSVLDEHERQVANAGLGYSGTFDNGTFPSVDKETATVTVFDQYFEAGKYTVEVYTNVSRMVGDTYVENSDHVDLAMSVTAVENGFRWCRQDRISQSGPNLVMDCSVDSGTLTLEDDKHVDFSGGVFDLSDAAPGWHDGYLTALTGGSDFYGYLTFCSQSCDTPESSYDVTASYRDGTFGFAARQPGWCVEPIVTETSVWEYARGHGNLMWMMDSEVDGEGRDFGIEDPSGFQWTPNEGADAVVVMGNPMWCTDADGNQRSERLRAMFMVQGSGNDSGSSVPDTTLATTDSSVPVNQINVVTIQLPMPTEGAGGGPSLVVVPEGTPTVSIPANVVDGLIASVDGAQKFVLVETSDGHTVVLPEHRAGKVKVSAATDSITVTTFDRKGTKHVSTVKVAHSVSYATLARSAGGSGFPVVPVTAAVVVLLVAAGLLQVRRKKSV